MKMRSSNSQNDYVESSMFWVDNFKESSNFFFLSSANLIKGVHM